MADVHSTETRSYNMSRIRGKNTKPKLIVRQYLHSQGFRFRIHVRELPGTPDIVLPKFKIVIQIHGCFWHGHMGCKYFVLPDSKSAWWSDKIERTRQRDNESSHKLEQLGWKVITIYECELKSQTRSTTLDNLKKTLKICLYQ